MVGDRVGSEDGRLEGRKEMGDLGIGIWVGVSVGIWEVGI